MVALLVITVLLIGFTARDNAIQLIVAKRYTLFVRTSLRNIAVIIVIVAVLVQNGLF
ncbi:hypothetical protein H1230_12470 [Paenibacillus sp. 19GGS1-52]|uniref:hypothetical protein n=1 Tax=Paenibacillus sp. 19GGS1-52 TaxID=2758563 RepID=UPI001EFAE053|nr:hypothetical protein [Paenibacillus sp. 19GGS1-52]ULO09511.1 hypothetical protein H1230_12470 [Paenibacillus sp. 19GGS1-52]